VCQKKGDYLELAIKPGISGKVKKDTSKDFPESGKNLS
jgi:hypothetical protein